MKELKIVEGVAGYWYYHLAPADKTSRALCGAWTMRTSIGLDRWGAKCGNEQIRYKWCSKCADLSKELSKELSNESEQKDPAV